jgi:hypothetical protein
MMSKLVYWWKGSGMLGRLNDIELDFRERYKNALKFLIHILWVSLFEWRGVLGGLVWTWLYCLLSLVSFGVWVGLWVGTQCTHKTFLLLSVESCSGEECWDGFHLRVLEERVVS